MPIFSKPIFCDITRVRPIVQRDVITQIETDVGQLEEALAKILREGCTELDMLIWVSRFSLESIGQAGIGIPFDTLVETSQPVNTYSLQSSSCGLFSLCLFSFHGFWNHHAHK